MPIFFGFRVGKKATNLIIDTPQGAMEPAEPSKVRVFATAVVHSLGLKVVFGVLGHLVSVISHPVGYFLPFASIGARTYPPSITDHLPFRLPGLGFAIKKGRNISDATHQDLEARHFTNITLNGFTIYIKERGTRDDYIWVYENIPDITPNAVIPSHYLNLDQFRGFLIFRNVSVQILRVMNCLRSTSNAAGSNYTAILDSSKVKGYKKIEEYDGLADIAVENQAAPSFEKTPVKTTETKKSDLLTMFNGVFLAADGLDYSTPAAFTSTPDFCNNSTVPSFISVVDQSTVPKPGLFFKFVPKMAIPDPQVPGDVIGKYFLSALGEDIESQFVSLNEIKAGLGGMRLTELSDCYSHIFKCVEIAIMAEAGCVPVFSSGYYEGCIVSGGPGAYINVSGTTHSFVAPSEVINDVITSSSHALSLQFIANIIPAKRQQVNLCKSMFDLREICVNTPLTPDDMSNVVVKARDLRFPSRPWTISPANLKASLSLMVDLTKLDGTYPISADTLFSKDPVLIALSVFGEACPSWEIPSGTFQSISVDAPPNPPTSANMKSTATGQINDAAWVMQVRRIHLVEAVDSFKRMARAGGYRTITSALARKQGYLVFQRGRMIEFWNELKNAFRTINPDISATGSGDTQKRKVERDQTDEQTSKRSRL